MAPINTFSRVYPPTTDGPIPPVIRIPMTQPMTQPFTYNLNETNQPFTHVEQKTTTPVILIKTKPAAHKPTQGEMTKNKTAFMNITNFT